MISGEWGASSHSSGCVAKSLYTGMRLVPVIRHCRPHLGGLATFLLFLLTLREAKKTYEILRHTEDHTGLSLDSQPPAQELLLRCVYGPNLMLLAYNCLGKSYIVSSIEGIRER